MANNLLQGFKRLPLQIAHGQGDIPLNYEALTEVLLPDSLLTEAE